MGTPLALSYVNSSLDPRVWGESARRFEPYEHAELLWGDRAVLNGFNSVGERGGLQRAPCNSQTVRNVPPQLVSCHPCNDQLASRDSYRWVSTATAAARAASLRCS